MNGKLVGFPSPTSRENRQTELRSKKSIRKNAPYRGNIPIRAVSHEGVPLKKMYKTALACVAIAIATTLTACSGVVPQGTNQDSDEKAITFATVPGFEDALALTGLWSVLLEEKGYTVRSKSLDLAACFAGVARGDLDGYLSAWLPSTHASFVDKYQGSLDVVNPGYFANDRLLLAVPKFVSENIIPSATW